MITAQRDAYIQFQWLRFFDSFLIVIRKTHEHTIVKR